MMNARKIAVGFCLLTSVSANDVALAQSAEHVAAVANQLEKSYVRTDSINGCPVIADELLGWPKSSVSHCVYKTASGLDGSVYVLNIAPEIIARWIETSCGKALPGSSTCFTYVLACGRWNSSYIFPVGGNVIENHKNYFFRNGMTVNPFYNGKTWNRTTAKLDIDDVQNPIAMLSDSDVARSHPGDSPMPSGLTRFWRTLPRHVAISFPDSGAPIKVDSAEERLKWLEVARTEILSALKSPENRLLSAYLEAHPQTIKGWSHDSNDAMQALTKQKVGDQVCPQEDWP